MKQKFLLDLENKVKETISKYKLLNKSEKIIVATSGGKDSAVVLYLLKKFGYNVSALYINLRLGEYSEKCENAVKELCEKEHIKLHILDIKKEFGMRMCNLRCGVQQNFKVSNCMVCGIIKKQILNKNARKLGADKIVTGHHLDDEAQTIIMNFLQGNLMLGANSGPRTGIVQNEKFVARIKPLYFISEQEIKKYSQLRNLPVVYEKCPCAANSLRIRTREFANVLDKKSKLKIVDNFLKILPNLAEKLKNEKIIECRVCREPSRTGICKTCSLLYKDNTHPLSGRKNR